MKPIVRDSEESETMDTGSHRRRDLGEWLRAVGRDARHALRGMARRPGFAAAVITTLALGIGANTAIFSVVNAVLLRPLPVEGLDRLVVVRGNAPGINLYNTDISPAEALDVFERHDVFQSSAAFSRRDLNLSGSGEPKRVAAVSTLGEFFGVFGARPHLGRLYRPEDSEDGNHMIAVLSYAFWQELAGGDPRVIGSTLRLNDQSYEIVGVMPPEFRYPRSAQLWIPHEITAETRSQQQRGRWFVTAVARLRPGITMEQLRGQLVAEAERWQERFGGTYDPLRGRAPVAVPFVEYLAGQLRPILLVLMGAVAFVLLIACANVASLQLVRATGRAKEIAVRVALGAGRWPIVRQLFVESVVLAIAGGLLGLVVGDLVVRVIARSDVAQFAMLRDVRLDTPVLVFTALVTLIAAILFGTFPAFRAASVTVHDVLKESSRGTSSGPVRNRFLQSAVVVQVALALVLLLGSGLLIRSLERLLETDPGFRTENVLAAQLSLNGARYQEKGSRLAVHDALLERLRAAPGVQAAGTVFGLPFSDMDNSNPIEIPGKPVGPGEPQRHANMWFVGGEYFRAMGVPLLAGRLFSDADPQEGSRVTVIDETLARQYFPGENPVGKQIVQGWPATIIGVVGSVKKSDLTAPNKATTYYHYREAAGMLGDISVVVRSATGTSATAGSVRAVVRQIDKNLPVFDVIPMAERVERSLGARRLAMTVLTGFAAVSLLLAALGIYGVLSYSTSQRTHEIGIRLALGAKPGDVIGMVLRNGLLLASAGMLAGALVFLGVGRALAALLYGVGPRDPLTVMLCVLLLAAAALLGCYLPARRAAKVDPMVALREQ